MSNISFIKYHGTGNDFILIDDRGGAFPKENPHLIQRMCHRQFGIGANGVIFLVSVGGGGLGMRIFNSDGQEAESCGNALRCVVHFLKQERVEIKTRQTTVVGFFERGCPVIELGKPGKIQSIETEWGLVHCVDTGVPHAVRFVPNVDLIDLPSAGAEMRNRFQANADFAALQKDGSIRVRTFERGIEEETLSCGTGAAAVARIALSLFGLEGTIPLHFRGGKVEIWEKEGNFYLAGPAEKVFTGSYPFP